MNIEKAKSLLESNGYTIEYGTVNKNNNEYKALIVRMDGNISPTINERQLQTIESEEELMESINRAIEEMNNFLNVESITKKDFILENCRMCVKQRSDEDILKEYAYEDLELYIRVFINDEASYIVGNTPELLGITKEELWRNAWKNSEESTECMSLAEKMGLPFTSEDIFFVASNNGHYGASVIANTDYLEKLCEGLDTDRLLMIPSSIHEILVIRNFEEKDIKIFEEMVKEVNDTQVDEEDRLSYKVYKYYR